MSKCNRCGKPLNFVRWFHHCYCDSCIKKTDIHYGDDVKVTDGFYSGQFGKVIGHDEDDEKYLVRLNDNSAVQVDDWAVEK